MLFDLLENLLSQKTEVESSRSHFVPDEGLAQDQDGVAILSKGVLAVADWFQPDLRVPSHCLQTGGSVVSPPLQVIDTGDPRIVGLRLRAQVLP